MARLDLRLAVWVSEKASNLAIVAMRHNTMKCSVELFEKININ